MSPLEAKPPWTSGSGSLNEQHRHVGTGPRVSRWPSNVGTASADVCFLGLNGSQNDLKVYYDLCGTVAVVVPLVLLLWNKQMELGRHQSFCFTLNVLHFQTWAKYQLSGWVKKLQKSVKKALVLSEMFSCFLCLDDMLWFFFFNWLLNFILKKIYVNIKDTKRRDNINIKEYKKRWQFLVSTETEIPQNRCTYTCNS